MTDAEPSLKNHSNSLEKSISRRLSRISVSATLAVDTRAKALKAAGENVIGFGAGEPDFPTPAPIVDAAIHAAGLSANHHYSPVVGLPELRQAIAEKTRRDSGYAITADQVLVTNGGKQAVYEAFAALLNPGDEVLLPTPYWTTYPEVIKFCDGVPVEIFAGPDADYKVTVDQLEAALTPRTKILLFVSPSNPTGAVYTPEETRAIGQWAASKNLWVITDEIYEHLTYDEVPSVSIASAVPELGSKVIIVNGVAKTYAMTGWRVGWLIADPVIVAAASKLQSHTTSNVANVSQRAAIAALTGSFDEVNIMKTAFNRRRTTIVKGLNAIEGLICPMPQGAFYAYPDVRKLLGSSFAGKVAHTSAELAQLILEEAKVALVPGEAFGPSGYLRLSYALSDADLAEGIQRLHSFFTKRD